MNIHSEAGRLLVAGNYLQMTGNPIAGQSLINIGRPMYEMERILERHTQPKPIVAEAQQPKAA